MKSKIIIIGLTAIIIGSCTSPRYLPFSDEIDVNEYGSYINLIGREGPNIAGELIAVDNDQIVLLTEDPKKCVTVPISEVKRFSLWYAKSKHYGWTIPVYTVATVGHGLFSIITAPINLIVTISVVVSEKNAFKYSNKNMTYDELKMFARFPQGIPPSIDLASIR